MALTASAEVYTPQTVPFPRKTDAMAFVSNPDGILTAAEQEAIQDVAMQLYRTTGVEMVTVVLDDIGDADAFGFSVELFNTWGIGHKGDNTGLLVLFALQSRDIRITTGGGLEGVLPDITCTDILYDTVIPILKTGAYGEGLLAANVAFAEHLTQESVMAELLLDYQPQLVTEWPWFGLGLLSFIIGLISALGYTFSPRCPQCRHRGPYFDGKTLIRQADYSVGGLDIYHFTCPYCGHKWDKEHTTPKKIRSYGSHHGGGGWSSGGSSYSGGSFGGGSTSGGGAGGKF